jgi:uncharacterized protein YbjT (DUF2867 family)
MKVVVAGGTGFVGRGITAALLNSGHDVTVLSRSRPAKDPIDGRAAWAAGDVTAPDTLAAALAGSDAVVDAVQFPNSPIEDPKKGRTFERIDLQGTKNLVDAAKAAGVSRFIDVSGVGAAEGARFHWLQYKWDEEQYIKGSGVPYTILRGSWIYGPRDVSLNRFLGFAKFLPFVPVIGNGKTRINPLFVDDMGKHVAVAVERDDLRGRLFEVGGPDVLTMDEVIRTALKVKQQRRFLLHQPAPLMKALGGIAQHLPGRPLTPDAIDFITMDGVADTGGLVETFGIRLTPLEEALATYLAPK